MRVVLAIALIAFIYYGCGGGGGDDDPYKDLTCARVTTNPYLFDMRDYESQRVSYDDTLSAYQWHLKNWGQKTGAGANSVASNQIATGADLRVEPVWKDMNITGRNVVIAVLDNGTDVSHPDLAPNYDENLSWNYITNDKDPYPFFTARACAHGTATAAIAAAKGGNDGVIGVAPDAKIAALNIGLGCGEIEESRFSAAIVDALSALLSATRGNDLPIDIFSNSWGCDPAMDCLYQEHLDAIYEGTSDARGQKGTIYLFAAGNHRSRKVRSDYSPHLSEFEILPIAALDAQDRYAAYSNPGANLLVSAYGGDNGGVIPGIVTADIVGCDTGFNSSYFMPHKRNNYGGFTTLMNGTSAATPMVAGVVALMLEANPNLTWRDVRYILATTARKNDPQDSDWRTNGAGWHVNHNYGFGAVDAFAAVTKAKDFASLGTTLLEERNITSLDGKTIVIASPIKKIEYVNIVVKLTDYESCGFGLTLISPSGASARFVENDIPTLVADQMRATFLGHAEGDDGYGFGSPRFLDENASGTWRLELAKNSDCPNFAISRWSIYIKGRS
ncbi:MAG: S8 family serine peptidase [Helicobacteraceae bacterium]|jgi:kexin|nr:S8 family serine peptidase [Helicobacteraceae bacterium]